MYTCTDIFQQPDWKGIKHVKTLNKGVELNFSFQQVCSKTSKFQNVYFEDPITFTYVTYSA